MKGLGQVNYVLADLAPVCVILVYTFLNRLNPSTLIQEGYARILMKICIYESLVIPFKTKWHKNIENNQSCHFVGYAF